MKRLIRALVAAVLFVGVLTMTASPASAHTEVCVGQGVGGVGSPLFFPGLGPAKNTSFSFGLGVGLCSASISGTFTASGSISGPLGGAYCGLASGSGVAKGHHPFTFVGAGTIAVLSGGVVGVVHGTLDVTIAESCIDGADRWIVTGAVLIP